MDNQSKVTFPNAHYLLFPSWNFHLRVSSKTDIKTWNKSTGSGKLFSMDLMDESGEIRITAFKEQVDAFYDKAVVGKVYFIRYIIALVK